MERNKMVFKSIYSTACICACLVSPLATAATVWTVDLINEDVYRPKITNPWTMYIVTEEDQLTEHIIPTGVYIGQSKYSSGIDPVLLLTRTPQQMASDVADNYALYSMDSSIMSLQTTQFAPGEFELTVLKVTYAQQAEYNFDTHLLCTSTTAYCGVNYFDPFVGVNNTILYADNGVITSAASTIPIPPALWLFGSGLLALIGLSRRVVVA